jgi:hypothetical protein
MSWSFKRQANNAVLMIQAVHDQASIPDNVKEATYAAIKAMPEVQGNNYEVETVGHLDATGGSMTIKLASFKAPEQGLGGSARDITQSDIARVQGKDNPGGAADKAGQLQGKGPDPLKAPEEE